MEPKKPWKVSMPQYKKFVNEVEFKTREEAYERVGRLRRLTNLPLVVCQWQQGGWQQRERFPSAEGDAVIPGCENLLPQHTHCIHGHTSDCPDPGECDIFPRGWDT